MLTLDDRTAEQDRRQEVLSELVEAVRLTTPIEQVGAWLFRSPDTPPR